MIIVPISGIIDYRVVLRRYVDPIVAVVGGVILRNRVVGGRIQINP